MALGAQLSVAIGPQRTLAILGDLADSLTATGTGQSTAYAINATNSYFTTVGSGTGAVLPSGGKNDLLVVGNFGANALSVYPPTGGKLNGLTANWPAVIPPGKIGIFYCRDTINYAVLFGA